MRLITAHIAVMVLLVACAGVTPRPETNAGRLAVVEAELTAAYRTTADLVESDTLTVEQARDVRDRLDTVAERLDQARGLLEAGQSPSGRVQAAQAVLGAVQSELQEAANESR